MNCKSPLTLNIRTRRSHSAIQIPFDDTEASQNVQNFVYSYEDFIYDLRTFIQPEIGSVNKQRFNDVLISRWEEAKKQKVFNYNLNCMYKLLPGDFDLSMQLNVERGELRRKPMRFHAVREPFNSLRWNFTKLKRDEILMYLRCKDVRDVSPDLLDRHLISINAAPIERGHSIIVPDINRCLPQILNENAVRVATDLMLLASDEMFHVAFNSLLGHASVNHLHLHLTTWPYDSDLINRKCEHLFDNLYVIRRPTWFIHTFVFQLASPAEYGKFVKNIALCADYLSSNDIAHNLFLSRAQPLRTTGELTLEDRQRKLPLLVTAYLFPRTPVQGAKPVMNICPAAFELAGCLIAHTWRHFESITEEAVLRIVDEEATLPDSRFNQICAEIADVIAGRKISFRNTYEDDNSTLSSPELDEMRDSFRTFELHSPRHHLTSEVRKFTFNTAQDDAEAGDKKLGESSRSH